MRSAIAEIHRGSGVAPGSAQPGAHGQGAEVMSTEAPLPKSTGAYSPGPAPPPSGG